MTSSAAFIIRCPNCFYTHLVSLEVIQYLQGYYCYKCECDLKKELDETVKEYHEFMNIVFGLGRNEKDNEKIIKYDKLRELYNKRTIL